MKCEYGTVRYERPAAGACKFLVYCEKYKRYCDGKCPDEERVKKQPTAKQ